MLKCDLISNIAKLFCNYFKDYINWGGFVVVC